MGKILITGADGFIGSHLTEALVRQGYDVRAFVQYNSFNSWGWLDRCATDVAGKFDVFAGDVRDPHGVRTAMQGCDAVLHLAALIASGKRQIKLGAIRPTRDFNYVADTVSGFIAALKSEQGAGEVINLGSNYEISIGDTVKVIAETMSADIEIVTDEQRLRRKKAKSTGCGHLVRKAASLLGWKPNYGSVDGFRCGVAETMAWFREPVDVAAYKSDIYNL